MYIEKLTSGSYRITETREGVRYRVTVKEKPTKKQAEEIIEKEIRTPRGKRAVENSFEKACEKYVANRSNTCSPSTLRGYQTIKRTLPEWFRKEDVRAIRACDVERMINEYAEGHSPKSCRNVHGFVSAVLGKVRDDLHLNTTLPAKKPSEVYIPTDEEVKKILREVKGSKFEVPIYLAVFGLRRSEICALTLDDLEGNFLHVHRAKVQDRGEKWVIKETTKTAESNRRVFITDYVRDLILKQGYIYEGHPELIGRKLEEVEEKLGIKSFSLHKLRHYYASMSHEMGIPDADILAMGGWKTDHIMKSVYRHARENSVSKGQTMYAEKMKLMQAG